MTDANDLLIRQVGISGAEVDISASSLKTWITPKVITSTLDQTQSATAAPSDGASPGSHS
jgi:hypothetical protein